MTGARRLRGVAGLAVFLIGLVGGGLPLQGHVQGHGLQAPQPSSVVGSWVGDLMPMPGIELRLVFHITEANGVLQTTMDSPDQGVRGIPVAQTRFEADTLILEIPGVAGRFQGLRTSVDTIEGTWEQGGQAFALRLDRRDPSTLGRARPQEPRPPFPYLEEDVRYPNAEAGIHLAGTLTLPPGDGPFPAAILITGSGAQDRDETILGHKPFWVLADNLTRQGIAVLRSDDRGVGASEGVFALATSEDFATDVAAALAFLQQDPRIAPDQIGLIGHSEGGLIAPMVAVRSGGVAFQVLLAGPALPGEEILYLQGAAIQRAMGASTSLIDANTALQKQLFAVVREEADVRIRAERLEGVLKDFVAHASEGVLQEMGLEDDRPEGWIRGQIQALLSPWFRFFLMHDPRPDLQAAQIPTLALFGELDLQVPPAENVEALEALWKDVPHSDLTVVVFPGLNHLFQTAATGAPTEYGQIEETFAPVALERVASWIRERTGLGSGPLP